MVGGAYVVPIASRPLGKGGPIFARACAVFPLHDRGGFGSRQASPRFLGN